MIKTTKNNKSVFKFLKIILTLIVGILVYFKLKNIDYNQLKLPDYINYSSFFIALALLFPNYYFEYKKWDLTIKTIQLKTTFQLKIQSFFAGIITGMITPNMQGNFIGRIYYFQRRERINIVLLTLISNLGQFCTTISLGLIGFWFANEQHQSVSIIPFIILIFGLLFYFYFDHFSFVNKHFKWLLNIKSLLKKHNYYRLKILFYSVIRTLIFSFQFLFIFHAFGVEFQTKIFWLILELYLFTTLAPSLFLGKLFVRETIALYVFSTVLIADEIIILTSLTIWIINLLIPTLLGLLICKRNNI